MRNKDSLLNREGQPDGDKQVIREILQYLWAHPNAKDTFDGVLRWWRPKNTPEWRKDDLQKGLDFLILKSWLTVRNLSRGQKIYGLNTEFMEEIKKFLIGF